MVARFLQWRLPDDFSPDAGVAFKPTQLQHDGVHPWPTGTNLLDYEQAEAMVRFIVGASEA